jgi:hypothetical protein
MLLMGALLMAAGALMSTGCAYQRTYDDGKLTGVQVVVSVLRKDQALGKQGGTIVTDGSGWVQAHSDFGSNLRQAYDSETTRLGMNLADAYFGMERQLRDQSEEMRAMQSQINNLTVRWEALGFGPRAADGATTGTE